MKLRYVYVLFLETSKKEYLTSAIQLIPSVSELIEEQFTSFSQEEDQLTFNHLIAKFYDLSIDVLYEQYLLDSNQIWLEKIFKFSEKNKVHALLSKLSGASALQLANIPFLQKRQLQELQSKITITEKKVQSILKTENDSLKDEYTQKLVEYQVAHHQLIQELEIEYPDYLQFKNQIPTLDIEDIQN